MRREVLVEALTDSAGINSAEDRYKVGYIAALNDMLQISLDELKET